MNKKPLLLAILIFVILFACWIGWGILFGNKQELNIHINQNTPGVDVKVYSQKDEDNDNFFTDENLVYQTAGDSSVKLKKGKYLVVGSGNEYEDAKYEVELTSTPETIDIDPSFTSSKLNELLQDERTNILQILKSDIPMLKSNNYRIYDGKLYKQGQWYGTVITKQASDKQRESAYYDVFRVVLQKNNNKWALVNKTPLLIIPGPDYPDVPREVLVDINKLTE